MINTDNLTYQEFLALMTTEFSEFMKEANYGESVRHAGLKARKKSVRVREMLKDFRYKSLEQEKKLNQRFYNGKYKNKETGLIDPEKVNI